MELFSLVFCLFCCFQAFHAYSIELNFEIVFVTVQIACRQVLFPHPQILSKETVVSKNSPLRGKKHVCIGMLRKTDIYKLDLNKCMSVIIIVQISYKVIS